MTGPSDSDQRLPGEELVFQMSSEAHRRSAIDVIAALYGSRGVRAFPRELGSTAQTLLVIMVADDEDLKRAISAVLTVDPDARQPMGQLRAGSTDGQLDGEAAPSGGSSTDDTASLSVVPG